MVFSSNAVGDAIVTDKPVIKKKLKRNAVTGKFKKSDVTISILDIAHKNPIEGSSTRVALPYSHDVYKKLIQLRSDIVRLQVNVESARNKQAVKLLEMSILAKERKIDTLIKGELDKLFDDVKQIIPKKGTLKMISKKPLDSKLIGDSSGIFRVLNSKNS